MSVDIILKDIEWDGVNKIRVPLEGGGTQDFSIGGGSANLQTKSKTYTPTTSQQTDTVSPDTGYDGLSSVNVTVNAIPTGSAGTPTATKGTVSNHSVSVTPSVTNTTGYITGGTKTGTSVSVSASELVSGSQTVAGNGTFDVTNLAQLIVDTPTMNLPSATSSSPTGTRRANLYPSTSQQYLNIPSGLNDTAQYYQLIGMDLAPLNVTQNGTYNASDVDITGFNTVTVNVPSGSSTCDTKTMTNDDSQATSIEFTGLSGQPKWFFVRCTSQLSRSSSYSYYFVTAVRYNGTNHYGNYYRRSNGTFYNDTAHYSHTYSNGTLTVSSSANRGAAGGSFYNGNYELVYIY